MTVAVKMQLVVHSNVSHMHKIYHWMARIVILSSTWQ